MVQSLLSLTETRDAETGRHSRRTRQYTRLLAEQLAAHPDYREYLTPFCIDLLATLAPLHDIGKVGVPDQLLNKPGELTPEEFREMQKHPVYGLDVITRAERDAGAHDDVILEMAKDIVYTHHERWDGKGYPRGLKGEQIPVAGRLIALVDVYDAMTTRRLYRQPLSHDQAVERIVAAKGTHFDPAVVEAFARIAPLMRTLSTDRVSFSPSPPRPPPEDGQPLQRGVSFAGPLSRSSQRGADDDDPSNSWARRDRRSDAGSSPSSRSSAFG